MFTQRWCYNMTISNLNYKILILTSSSSSPDLLGIVGSLFTTSSPAVLYFRISVTIFRFSFLIFTPFHFPPRGKCFDTPSPLGEGWEGGNLPIKSNKFFRLKICYHYCEELHSRRNGENKLISGDLWWLITDCQL